MIELPNPLRPVLAILDRQATLDDLKALDATDRAKLAELLHHWAMIARQPTPEIPR